MEKIRSFLSKERKDQQTFAFFLVIYTALFVALGYRLADIVKENCVFDATICPDRNIFAPFLFLPLLLIQNKLFFCGLLVAYWSTAFGFSCKTLFFVILKSSEPRLLFPVLFCFLLQSVLKLSLLIYLSFTVFSHTLAGKTMRSKQAFICFCLFCVGVWFTIDLLYNSVNSLFNERIYNALQSF